MVQANVDLNSGSEADVYVRLRDRANGYRIRLGSAGNIKLQKIETGAVTDVYSTTYSGTDVALKIKVSDTTIKAWVDGTLKINTTDSTFDAGCHGQAKRGHAQSRPERSCRCPRLKDAAQP